MLTLSTPAYFGISGTGGGHIVPRSLKSGLVLPTQIFGLFGPPKKRVDFDKFNQ